MVRSLCRLSAVPEYQSSIKEWICRGLTDLLVRVFASCAGAPHRPHVFCSTGRICVSPDDYAAVAADAHCAVDPGGGTGATRLVYGESGLVDRPSVSQYRLTAHLGVAVAIIRSDDVASPARERRLSPALKYISGWGWVLVLGVYTLILSGGFMAGTDAGFAYPHGQ